LIQTASVSINPELAFLFILKIKILYFKMSFQAKSNLKRVSLELGGKSPVIILNMDDSGGK